MNPEPKRVLLAEDHFVSRHLLERNLANWGFEVVGVEDGEAALKVLEADNPPALVVLDWIMPKMDGLEVTRRVRAHTGRPYIYLVLITTKGKQEELATALAAGVDDYLIKPFDPGELHARLKVGRRVVALERALERERGELREARAELAKLRPPIASA